MNVTVIRLLNQQLYCPEFATPQELVRHMGAIQAQEYRLVRWAVAMRTKEPSIQAFQESFDKGLIVRSHLFRCTWQVVTGEDYWWMVALCKDKATQTLRGWMHANKIRIAGEEAAHMRALLAEIIGQYRSITKEQIQKELQAKGIRMDDHRLSYHIRLAEFDGMICSGNLSPMKASYALAEEKIGHYRNAIDRDEALMKLTLRYFQSRQPATFDDFVWWSGLNAGDCKRGIAMLGNQLQSMEFGERKFYFTEHCRTRGFRKGRVLLVPPYDEYLIGYKSRDIVLKKECASHAHNNSGNFYPIVVKDGKVCGNWSPFEKTLKMKPFGDEAIDEKSSQVEWGRYSRAMRM